MTQSPFQNPVSWRERAGLERAEAERRRRIIRREIRRGARTKAQPSPAARSRNKGFEVGSKVQFQQILVVVLGVILVVTWRWTQRSSSPVTQVTPSTPTAADAAQRLETPSVSDQGAEEAFRTQDLGTLRDPFQLPSRLQDRLRQRELAREEERNRKAQSKVRPVEEPVKPPLVLQGILWGTARPQAIINRKIVSVGDTMEGAKILAVSKEGVTISFEGQTFQMNLPQPNRQERRDFP